jgi:hypothetical protein
LFPGDSRIWRATGIVALLGLLMLAVWLVVPRDYYTGTNSVENRGQTIYVVAGQRLCLPDLQVPAGTARVQLAVYTTKPRTTIDADLRSSTGARMGAGILRGTNLKWAFTIPRRPDSPAATGATLCLHASAPVTYGGMYAIQPDDPPPTIDGKPSFNRIAVWYLPPAGDQRSILGQLPTMFERATLFRPGAIGRWTYWLLLFVWMPLAGYFALRLLATAGTSSRRRLFASVAALAIANAAAWALITPSFDAPDEQDHFAYVQYFAETGHRVAPKPDPRYPQLSTQEQLGVFGVRLTSHTENSDGRPPWLRRDERLFEERSALHGDPPPRADGGGNLVPTQLNTPLYYASVAPAYLLTRDDTTYTQLAATRLLSSLYAGIVALCAFAIVREIIPRHPGIAVAAGLLVAFEPMFAFISGSVNDDGGVNAMSALAIWLSVRGLRRGLTRRTAVALALILVAIPAMKPTGYSIYPLVLLALAGMLWRRHDRAALTTFAWFAATFGIVTIGWHLLLPVFDQPPSPVPLSSNTVDITTIPARHDPLGYVAYLWQVFFPPVLGQADHFTPHLPFYTIYIKRGFAAFGWYQIYFPNWVYRVILATMLAVAACGVLAVRRYRDWARRHWMEVLFVVLVPFVVFAAVEAAFYTPTARIKTAEFGRYVFPAMAALGALAAGACFAFGRRRALPVAAGLAAVMVVFNYASQFLTLAGFYT